MMDTKTKEEFEEVHGELKNLYGMMNERFTELTNFINERSEKYEQIDSRLVELKTILGEFISETNASLYCIHVKSRHDQYIFSAGAAGALIGVGIFSAGLFGAILGFIFAYACANEAMNWVEKHDIKMRKM